MLVKNPPDIFLEARIDAGPASAITLRWAKGSGHRETVLSIENARWLFQELLDALAWLEDAEAKAIQAETRWAVVPGVSFEKGEGNGQKD